MAKTDAFVAEIRKLRVLVLEIVSRLDSLEQAHLAVMNRLQKVEDNIRGH